MQEFIEKSTDTTAAAVKGEHDCAGKFGIWDVCAGGHGVHGNSTTNHAVHGDSISGRGLQNAGLEPA
jgi:hypothetical protein